MTLSFIVDPRTFIPCGARLVPLRFPLPSTAAIGRRTLPPASPANDQPTEDA